MRSTKIILSLGSVLSATAIAIAEPLTIQQAAPPATQPVAVTAAGDVYVTAFLAVGDSSRLEWAGTGVQQNLVTDLARGHLRPVAATGSVADARSAAKDAGARYLITGTYQSADDMLRFTGQIIEVASGTVIGGLSATGADRDLFSMEDALSGQAIKQLNQLSGVKLADERATKPAGVVPPGLQPAIIVQIVQPPAVGAASSYEGSTLQTYVENNRTPSTDFNQQLQDTRYRNTYAGYSNFYGNYLGGYGFSLLYNVGTPLVGFNSFYGGSGFGAGGYFHHGGHSGFTGNGGGHR